jgi:hypothetical protein
LDSAKKKKKKRKKRKKKKTKARHLRVSHRASHPTIPGAAPGARHPQIINGDGARPLERAQIAVEKLSRIGVVGIPKLCQLANSPAGLATSG